MEIKTSGTSFLGPHPSNRPRRIVLRLHCIALHGHPWNHVDASATADEASSSGQLHEHGHCSKSPSPLMQLFLPTTRTHGGRHTFGILEFKQSGSCRISGRGPSSFSAGQTPGNLSTIAFAPARQLPHIIALKAQADFLPNNVMRRSYTSRHRVLYSGRICARKGGTVGGPGRGGGRRLIEVNTPKRCSFSIQKLGTNPLRYCTAAKQRSALQRLPYGGHPLCPHQKPTTAPSKASPVTESRHGRTCSAVILVRHGREPLREHLLQPKTADDLLRQYNMAEDLLSQTLQGLYGRTSPACHCSHSNPSS